MYSNVFFFSPLCWALTLISKWGANGKIFCLSYLFNLLCWALTLISKWVRPAPFHWASADSFRDSGTQGGTSLVCRVDTNTTAEAGMISRNAHTADKNKDSPVYLLACVFVCGIFTPVSTFWRE